MKKLISALAAATLLVTPMAAVAQGHGGGGHAGGFHGGGFHGGYGWRGGYGWHGGYGWRGAWGWGWRGWGFWPFYAGFGFALAADPWFYSFPGYDWDWGPDAYAGPPPPVTGAAPPAACGAWVWRTDPAHYEWVPQACAPAGAPAAAPPPAGS